MAITPIQLVPAQYITGSVAIYYTSTNIKTRIDKATFTNNDNSNAHTVSVYLVPVGGTANPSNLIVNARSVAAKATYHTPELVGHMLAAGDSLQAVADVANFVAFAAAGVTVSP